MIQRGTKTRNAPRKNPVGVGRIFWVEVGLDGKVERENDDHVDRAAEPCKLGFEERACFREILRSEPVLFVGEVDQLGWQRGNEAGDAESDEND